MKNTIGIDQESMKRMKLWMSVAVLMLCVTCGFFNACNSCSNGAGSGCRYVSGTMDGPMAPDSLPVRVQKAMEQAGRFHNYEIMCDTVHAISVDAIAEVDTTSTEGYGIVVVKGAVSTTFPSLRNTRCPMARYDGKSGTLWLSCSAMEGTGVHVERLYKIRFDGNDKAYIEATVDPYDLQQQLCRRLGYLIKEEEITFYDGKREIAHATNTVKDMGGFDMDQPLWIGEQIQYDLSGDFPCLLVTPGIKFATSPVLSYDDMPAFTAPLTIDKNGTPGIGDILPVSVMPS